MWAAAAPAVARGTPALSIGLHVGRAVHGTVGAVRAALLETQGGGVVEAAAEAAAGVGGSVVGGLGGCASPAQALPSSTELRC